MHANLDNRSVLDFGMDSALAYLLLVFAAILEAVGDAMVCNGLHSQSVASKLSLFVVGGLVLFGYGVAVNSPAWDFGKLLGVYVILCFLVAQAINYFAYNVRPDLPIMVGGALIVSGGVVITF